MYPRPLQVPGPGSHFLSTCRVARSQCWHLGWRWWWVYWPCWLAREGQSPNEAAAGILERARSQGEGLTAWCQVSDSAPPWESFVEAVQRTGHQECLAVVAVARQKHSPER